MEGTAGELTLLQVLMGIVLGESVVKVTGRVLGSVPGRPEDHVVSKSSIVKDVISAVNILQFLVIL